METLIGKADNNNRLDLDDVSNIKFPQQEIDRSDEEINTMKKYLDYDDDVVEVKKETFAVSAPPSNAKLTIVKIIIAVAIVTVAFGAAVYFPQIFQITTTPALNSTIMIAAFAAMVAVVLIIGFYL